MKIITNQSGTRIIEVSQNHLDTIKQYQLFRNLIDSNGIIDETVLDKLRLNVRSLLENSGTNDKGLMDLCFDIIYHPNMKAIGLHNLVVLYSEQISEKTEETETELNTNAE